MHSPARVHALTFVFYFVVHERLPPVERPQVLWLVVGVLDAEVRHPRLRVVVKVAVVVDGEQVVARVFRMHRLEQLVPYQGWREGRRVAAAHPAARVAVVALVRAGRWVSSSLPFASVLVPLICH